MSAVGQTLADGWTVTRRNLIKIKRVPDLLVGSIIAPIMFVLLFAYVFGGSIDMPGGLGYREFLVPGIFAQTVLFGATFTGAGLARDMQLGIIDRFRSLPMARSAVLTGRTVADLVRNAFIVVVMLLVGLLVGFRPEAGPLGWAGAAGLMLLFGFSFSWIAATIALLIGSVEAVQSAGFIWLFPLTFASSAFVPTDSMPDVLRAFANNQPITLIVDTVRGLLLDRPVGPEGWQALAWCVGILLVFVPLSISLYRRVAAR